MSRVESMTSNPLGILAVCPESVANTGIIVQGPLAPDWLLDGNPEACVIRFPQGTRYARLPQILYPSLIAFSLPTGECLVAYVKRSWMGERWLQLRETEAPDAEWQEGGGILNVPLPSPVGLLRMQGYVSSTYCGWFQLPEYVEQYVRLVNHGEYAQLSPQSKCTMYELLLEWEACTFVYIVLHARHVVVVVRGHYEERASHWKVVDERSDKALQQALVAVVQQQGWFF